MQWINIFACEKVEQKAENWKKSLKNILNLYLKTAPK